jgi:hypothetical protein
VTVLLDHGAGEPSGCSCGRPCRRRQVEVPPLGGRPAPSRRSLAISPDWQRVVLQRRRTRDSTLVSTPNFSGACRRFSPRGEDKAPHELDLAIAGRRWAQGSGCINRRRRTPRRYNSVQKSTSLAAGVGWHLLARQHKTPGPCMETNGVRWVAPLGGWVHVILQAHTTHAAHDRRVVTGAPGWHCVFHGAVDSLVAAMDVWA